MKPKLRKAGIVLPAIISLSLLALSLSHGQTSTWTSNNNGVWSNAANWDNGSPNSAAVNAVIDDGDSAVTVTLDGSRVINHLTLGADDTLSFNNLTTLSVAGDVLNNGLILSNSVGNNTGILLLNNTTHTFGGSGIYRFGASIANLISGGGTLVNSATHTFEGGGNFGNFQVGIDNAGLIRANQDGVVLNMRPSLTLGLTNTGTLRAENGGILYLTGFSGPDLTNTGGTIEALDGSRVRLGVGVSIVGGTLSTVGTGEIRIDTSNSAVLSNLSNTGNIVLGNLATLTIDGTIDNSGSISTDSFGNTTVLRASATGATLTGGGEVNLQNASAAGIDAEGGGRLTNTDNTIRGFGNVGRNLAAITNSAGGLIVADVLGQTLTLDPVSAAADGNASFINNGMLRAANGGTLLLTGFGGGAFTNNNLIEALNDSTVLFRSAASVTGGTFSTTGSGQIVVDTGENIYFTGITNTGTMVSRNNTDFGVSGTITNSGLIRITTFGNQTDIEVQAGGATFTGTGTLRLEGATTGINTSFLGTRLINSNHTIEGFGNIGRNVTAITNTAGSLINANVSGQTLVLDPVSETNLLDANPSFLNQGVLRASNGGILSLTGSGNGDFTNNNRIEALDGSEVQLTTNVRIIGGTLSTIGTGVFRGMANQNFDLENLTLAGNFIAANNTDLGITGTINNLGSIELTSSGNLTDLEIQAGGATLTGGGKVTLAATTTGINSVVTGTRFLNQNNTIEGRGTIGQNDTAITNAAGGLINANIAGQTLTLDPVANALDAGPSFLNQGTLRASNGGILSLTGLGNGDFTNNNRIEALDGSEVQLTTNVRIIGGTLSTTGTGVFRAMSSQNVDLENLTLAGNFIANNNTDLGITGTINNLGAITLTSSGN